MNDICKRLATLRSEMKKAGIDYYLVPTDDFHSSEYVGEYFKCRQYITGFTGSAGTALISHDKAGLWTDGRYFIQAEAELKGSGITLYKMRQPGVPTIHEYIKNNLKEGECLGFDGRTVSAQELKEFLRDADAHKAHINCEMDLVGNIWDKRPPLSCAPVMELDEKWTGCSRENKLSKIRAIMREKGAEALILTSLDDIAWLLNIRGGDIHCNPVLLSYLFMTESRVILFANEKAIGDDLLSRLKEGGITLAPYNDIYEYVKTIPYSKVMLDKSRVNSLLVKSLADGVSIIDEKNPTILLKAIKNPTEVENMKKAHIKDGVAMVNFLFWIKQSVKEPDPSAPLTELSAADKLHGMRENQEHFMGDSFDTIAAYKDHAAMCHYSPSPQSDVEIKAEGLLLVDSGGQYLEGTTDITRTIVMGPLTEEEKKYFTLVLKGHLNLASARFKEGCTGRNLDILARKPLWDLGEDYDHGTGHGVGYFLNVHEGPNSFRYQKAAPGALEPAFAPGMITSNEPGYYAEGKFGIRHENLVVCRESEKTQYGQFLCFENLTFVPFDREGIIAEMLTEAERDLLNNYHARVYEKISPYLEEAQRLWLKEATRPI